MSLDLAAARKLATETLRETGRSREADLARALLSALDALEAAPALWECPDCAFTFDAVHTDADGGYSCPACAELRLVDALEAANKERDEARELLAKFRPDIDPETGYGRTEAI